MNRWATYTFKNGKKAKNRVVVPPMASQTADSRGFVSVETLAHYSRLQESGAGIIFVEYSFIDQTGKGEPNQLGVNVDDQIAGLKKISDRLKQNGSLSGLQIVHVGGKSDSKLTGNDLIGASSIAVPIKGLELETPKEASLNQIKKLIQWYLKSAARAEQAGFDIVELHAAHGYGLNQWLSPITNQRTDLFGGDIASRFLLLKKIVLEIKRHHPNLLLAVRLPAQDHHPGGLKISEMVWVARQLEKLGVDLLDVSSGIGGWRRPKGKNGQGYLVDDAAILKSKVSLPVIGVGGIKTGEFVDSIIAEKKTDFAAIGRAILENPSQWNKKNLASSDAIKIAL